MQNKKNVNVVYVQEMVPSLFARDNRGFSVPKIILHYDNPFQVLKYNEDFLGHKEHS